MGEKKRFLEDYCQVGSGLIQTEPGKLCHIRDTLMVRIEQLLKGASEEQLKIIISYLEPKKLLKVE